MADLRKHLDLGSWLVIGITLALFVAAVFVKGLTHELLLEAGVFLVSVKLILLAYKSSVSADALSRKLDELHATLCRLEDGKPAPSSKGQDASRS